MKLLKPLLIAVFAINTFAFAQQAKDKELYELRTYELKFGSNSSQLFSYLKEVLKPTLEEKGAHHIMLFKELGNADPTKVWMLIAYPNASIYMNVQELHRDADYVKKASAYNALQPNNTLYNRIQSMLLLAFDGLPQMENPVKDAGLFELRIYEGYSEDATKRKIDMFNNEELDLFYETGLHPLFFGEQIIGPYRPCLTYMINFKDMDEHDANWKKFIDSPKWKKMAAKEEYANTVNNIRKTFLVPVN